MNDINGFECKNACSVRTPEFAGIQTDGSIEISGNTFLLSPQGCCSQTALPFWAKIIGRVRNSGAEEIFVKISVHLFDANEKIISSHSDIIVLDAGQRGDFDIKLTGYDKEICKYSIEAEETASF